MMIRPKLRTTLSIDVLDIMSQSSFETFEEETEEDIILDVVDITSQTYWENHSEWEIQLYIGVYYYYIWLYIRYIYIYNHTTTPQYSSQRQLSIENTSIDSIVNTFRKSFI